MTTNLAQAFHDFVGRLPPDAGQAQQLSERSQKLVKVLQSTWGPAAVLPIGSVARGTNIAPTHDVDWMVVVDRATFESAGVDKVLGEIESRLASQYRDHKLRAQKRSVGLLFPDFSLDVVPAVPRAKGGYQIPDVDAGKWIYTNPPKHADLVTEKNQATSGMASSLARALKAWNRNASVGLKSFHLEVMALRGIAKKPDSFAQGVRDAFAHVAGAVKGACGDPAESGTTLDGYLDDAVRKAISKRCEDAGKEIELAIADDKRGLSGAAVDRVRKLLGSPF